ncbi:calcineurin-like phosphoesterase [Lasiosphaeris hirsuta]|uniref:Calcineurin-like phosphoesterase n=1 Tax=Lasiosphaeris hirsuta TaxID=260670 RepID=A0AA40AEV7_9PEZI|nr:calcineurin-like phosphoesterase [Lasiosphaeris hirsuta]
MGLLTLLGLRRPSPWEPPTLLDALLASPLAWAVARLYAAILLLRGAPFRPPPGKPPIRVVCLSDTHGNRDVDVPDGDLLIHAGDLSGDGSAEGVQGMVDWLAGLPHAEKVLVAGNHDGWFDERLRVGTVDLRGARYLRGEMVTLEFKGGRRLNVYGDGAVPRCGGESHALQYDRDKHPWKGAIPDETDVLVTHTPPRFHRDLGLGCAGLLEEVWRVKPKLHVFGHVHWGHGRESVYYDECQKAYESLMARTWKGPIRDFLPCPAWLDALSVVWYGISSILWKWLMAGPGSNNGGLMVNASVMYGNTGKTSNEVTVVDL